MDVDSAVNERYRSIHIHYMMTRWESARLGGRGILLNRTHKKILVADIGGTNARFAVATKPDGQIPGSLAPDINHFAAFPCADFHSPIELIEHYSQLSEMPAFDAACFAVAGPVSQNAAYLTNLGWTIDGSQIEQQLNIPQVIIANDFEALARSVTALETDQLLTLHQPEQEALAGPISVMGPGTGFGLAQVFRAKGFITVIPTEGGHSSFVPHGELENAVWGQVKESMGRITIETLMSGVGIMRIYRALCSLKGVTPLNYEPSTISQLALDDQDETCVDTLKVFCSMLGGVASDIALTQGATGGVFLGGGILPKIAPLVEKSELLARFLDKPPMEGFVTRIPLHLITDHEAALIGAALLAEDTLNR